MPVPMSRAALEGLPAAQRQLLEAMIENIERLTGQAPGLDPIKALPPGASAGDVNLKVNEWLERAQG